MISFRNHVVTLVAVFLALAVGVVLGGGPLSEVGRDDGGPELTELRSAAAVQEGRADLGERFAAEAGPALYGGRLAERQVALVTMPGADAEQVTALTEQVQAAGGTVSATQPVGESLVNPSEKSLVDTLGSQLVAQLPDGSVAAEATTYDRIGQLLGLTVATTDPEGAAGSAQTAAVLEGLRGAGLVGDAEPGERRAPLVMLVLGDPVDGEGGDDIVAGLVRGLAAASVAVVVVDETSDGSDQLGRMRAAQSLGEATTVDGVEAAPGRVAAVLALVRGLETRGGAFGASGADGTLPLG